MLSLVVARNSNLLKCYKITKSTVLHLEKNENYKNGMCVYTHTRTYMIAHTSIPLPVFCLRNVYVKREDWE